MVAGEHFHPQAGGVSLGDGAAGGVTRRVVQRDEAEHVKLGLEPLVIEEASLGSSRSSDGQDAQAVAGPVLARSADRRAAARRAPTARI